MIGRLRLVMVAMMLGLLLAIAGSAPVPAPTTMTIKIAGKGDVVIELFTKEAPKTTEHIMKLADSGFYNGQKFFGVMKDPRPFLVRFGDPGTKSKSVDDQSIGKGGSGARIPYEETGKSHVKGAVGLSTEIRDRDGGDSQFYIMLDDKPFLDKQYTVFGQVVRGMEIVSAVESGDQVTSVTISRG
ncbi:MAG: peptidylprolyl isomerase [Armatimonadetes bacterium]|nr:peptidylprolyl isomerase [Armatimonadota bacterium]